jgi:asparagine synthase (glutamine-hydrolysing)
LNRETISAMTSRVAHRGPDGEGLLVRDPSAIGHRRLAIIDPEGGKQPLGNEDGSIWITYNGEMYNHPELKADLLGRGHVFTTNSDVETVVHAYEEWGEDCVKRFRGMFAFGIVDFRLKKLFLARDPLGIKPLNYLLTDDLFAFSSELQAFHAIPGLQLELDMFAIDEYLRLMYIPAPRTVFKQIRKLLPAHRMSVYFDGKIKGPDRYWELEFRPNRWRSENQWLEVLDETLRDSVRAHLLSDVPFGAFLSGGLDSSLVVAYMAQILHQPVKTFSIGFDEAKYDETGYAQLVAERWHTDHHVEIVHPDAMELLPKLVQHYGEQYGDSSAIPTYYVSRLARQYVPMVLSGDGGDEAFAGYKNYFHWQFWLNYHDWPKSPKWKRRLRPFATWIVPTRYPPPPAREASLDNWLNVMQYFDHAQRSRLWRKEYDWVVHDKIDEFEVEFAHTEKYNTCSKVQYFDIKTYLPFDILTKVDIASMAHGLEARTPFVDAKVMETAASIPQKMLINQTNDLAWEGKLLLKKLLKRYYPDEFIRRPKKGFSVPMDSWLKSTNEKRMTVVDRLTRQDSPLQEFFDPIEIQNTLKANASRQIWMLLFLDEWLVQNKKRIQVGIN